MNVFKTRLAATQLKRVLMLGLQIICAAFIFVILIAPTEEIRVLAFDLESIFADLISNFDLSQLYEILYDVRHEAQLC
jgi:hypothetical protein